MTAAEAKRGTIRLTLLVAAAFFLAGLLMFSLDPEVSERTDLTVEDRGWVNLEVR